MEILIKAAQLLLSLSILVVLHEMGHFLPAKLFRTGVEKFYLFFNPWFSLMKKKIGNTEYGIGWVPLGGYVKISGMIDESMDKEQLQKPPEPWEFRAKPAWQRLIIMVGGVTMNILLAIVIYAMIMFSQGERYLPPENAEYGIAVDSIGQQIGLEDGDKIVKVNGESVQKFSDIPKKMIIDQAQIVTVIRNGERKTLDVPSDFIKNVLGKDTPTFIQIRFPTQVKRVQDKSVAAKNGLQKSDQIIGINQTKTPYFHEFKKVVGKYKEEEVTLHVKRQEDTIDLPMTVPESGILGFMPKRPNEYFKTKKINYGFLASFPAGTKKAYATLTGYVKQFSIIFNPETEGYKHVGGFITIGKIFPGQWNWLLFWEMTALLSVILAFMNILPIPALDGGHVMFTLYEMISGRKPSEKFLEYAQMVGMVILLSLLIFANGQDLYKVFFK
jgi:regulator of sigma E protease